MQELIDRWAALEKMCSDCKSRYDGHCPNLFGWCKEYESILQVPTIEPKRGEWIIKPHGSYGQLRAFCSACGKHSGIGGIESNQRKPFCPNCGADMREEGADNGFD